MPYFKSQTGKVYFYSDEDVVAGWPLRAPEPLEPITDEEAHVMSAGLASSTNETLEEKRARWRVSRFQGRAALIQLNKLADVNAYMAQPTTPEIVKEAWASVQEFRRMSLMIMNVAIILGWSDEELDHLFEVAEAIGEV